MAGNLHTLASAGADEDREIVRESLTKPVGLSFDDAHFSGKMALGANAVAAVGIELRGVYNFAERICTSRFHSDDVRLARAVAALATYASFKKGFRSESVLRARKRL